MARAQGLDRGLPRGGELLAAAALAHPAWQGNRLRRQRHRPLLIGGIAAVATGQDQVLAGVRRHHEFLAGGAADGAAVGLHGHGAQAAAGEDPPVGLVHRRIGVAQAGLVGVEGIGVLHDEFTPPHQAEARTDLIAEFGLNLIEIHWQLAVGAQQIGRQGGDHLLVGGAEPQLPALPVLQVEHDPFPSGVAGPAAAALPELGGLQLGQEGFQGPAPVHFLPHHLGHLAQNPPHQGEIGVDPGREAADEASPKQQFVGRDLGLGRIVPQRHQHQAGDAHGRSRQGSRGSYHWPSGRGLSGSLPC